MLHVASRRLVSHLLHGATLHGATLHGATLHGATLRLSVASLRLLGKRESRGRNRYSDRHFMRASRLLEKSHLLPYALANMQVRLRSGSVGSLNPIMRTPSRDYPYP